MVILVRGKQGSGEMPPTADSKSPWSRNRVPRSNFQIALYNEKNTIFRIYLQFFSINTTDVVTSNVNIKTLSLHGNIKENIQMKILACDTHVEC
jgi:hypothetical protein